MKILVAIPTFENILPDTFRSVYRACHKYANADFDFIKGYDCAKARNEIMKKAIDGNYDYVLMVDSDVVIPENTLDCLLEHPVDICTGLYPRKNTKSHEIEAFKLGTKNYTNRFTFDEIQSVDRFQVKGCGFGCVLINVNILEHMSYPYFKYVIYDNGSVLSEDLYFCSQADRAGFSIWADPRVRCGHSIRGFQYE